MSKLPLATETMRRKILIQPY